VGIFSQEGLCLGRSASWTEEGGLPLFQGEGLRPLARARRPLSGTGRGGKGRGPTSIPSPFFKGLIGLSNADGFPKKEGNSPSSRAIWPLLGLMRW
jgi:hypothetical protein